MRQSISLARLKSSFSALREYCAYQDEGPIQQTADQVSTSTLETGYRVAICLRVYLPYTQINSCSQAKKILFRGIWALELLLCK